MTEGFRIATFNLENLDDEPAAYASGDDSPESYHAPMVAEFSMPGSG